MPAIEPALNQVKLFLSQVTGTAIRCIIWWHALIGVVPELQHTRPESAAFNIGQQPGVRIIYPGCRTIEVATGIGTGFFNNLTDLRVVSRYRIGTGSGNRRFRQLVKSTTAAPQHGNKYQEKKGVFDFHHIVTSVIVHKVNIKRGKMM